jgi:FAD/FMN-containing dehydrogenase
VYWALRGGGAGSWGVIVDATFRAFPTFNATRSIIIISARNTTSAAFGKLISSHAAHIKDLDSMHVGQYFFVNGTAAKGEWDFNMISYFPMANESASRQAVGPFLEEIKTLPNMNVTVAFEFYEEKVINDLVTSQDDSFGAAEFLGSRLIPEAAYEDPEKIGEMYESLFDSGSFG